MFGVNISGNFLGNPHKDNNSVSTYEGQGISKVRIILLQFDFLEMFLYSFVNLMRNCVFWEEEEEFEDQHEKSSKRNDLNNS